MANIATITNNIISALSGTTSQVLLGDATLTDFKLDSLTDVNVPTPGDGDVLKWNGTTLLWEASDSAGITGSGAAGQVAYFTGATTQTGSNNLFWDATNSRLGIGTNTPLLINEIRSAFNGVIPSLSNSTLDGAGLGIGNTGTNAFAVFGQNNGGQFYIQTRSRLANGTAFQILLNPLGGNVAIGGTTDTGQRLQVTGDTLLKGSGATSATTALTVQNSGSTLLFSTDNGGTTTVQGITNNDTSVLFRVRQQNTNTRFSVNALGQTFIGGDANAATDTLLRIERNFNPTSGTATHITTLIIPTINQTGGANGITRGLYVNPNLVAAANWRSIEWSNNSGWGLYGAGSANNHLLGNTVIGSTTLLGVKFSVFGDSILRGSGNTSATTALTVQNSDGTNLLRSRNDGALIVGLRTTEENYIAGYTSTSPFGVGQRTLAFVWGTLSGSRPNPSFYFTSVNNINYTSNTGDLILTAFTFNPTSGTAIINANVISPTINQTGGANGITRGLYVAPNLIAAANWRSIEWSNNTGWGLYGAGSANNYLAGALGIGSGALAGYNLRISKTITGSPTSTGIYVDGAIQNDVTAQARGIQISPTIASGTAVSDLIYYFTRQNTFTGTATNQFGFFVDNNLTGATNNYAFYSNIASGTGRWNLYMNGTANNYLAGSLGIGVNSLTGYNLRILKNITGSTFGFNVSVAGAVQSDVTNNASYIHAISSTQAATFTLPQIRLYTAEQGTFGAGSTVTDQIGFFAQGLVGATNNFGFYGLIAAATGRWNLYMGGTAANYLNGNTIMGTLAADSGEKLQVNGTMKVVGPTLAGVHLKIGMSGFLGTNTVPAIQFNTTTGIYTDSNRIFFVSAGSFSGGFSASGYIGNSSWVSSLNADNSLDAPKMGGYRQTAAGLTSGLGGNSSGDTSIATNNLARLVVKYTGEIGIGTTTPAYKLDVQGTLGVTGAATFSSSVTAASIISTGDATINGVRVGKGPNSLAGNTVLGESALNGVTTGTNNVAIGPNALDGTTTGNYNIAIGFIAGGIGANENTTGSSNIFIGTESQGQSATESNRTWIGSNTTTSTWLGGNLLLGTISNSTHRLDVVGTTRLSSTLLVGGITTLTNLAGTGTRIVVADASGNLSTQPTDTYLTSLSGEATNSGSAVTLTNSAVIGKVLTGLNVYSAAIAATDSILAAFGKIQGQIDGLQGGTIYKGSWNANTNTPAITSGTGTQGNYYVVTTAGTTTIDGVSSWAVGDWIIFNGTIWEKIPNVDAITSVNGQTGVVSLTTSNINEGTNLYYTDTRARAAISLTTSGSNGASTYSSGVLNIPTYTLAGLGGAAAATTITINGTAQDLSTDRVFNVGTVTSVSGTGTVSGLTLTGSITNSGSLTLGGTLTLTSGNVTTALGFTPYNSTNPAGYTTNTGTVTSIVAGTYLTGGTITGSGTIAVDATTTNTASKIVARDASGNFSAGTITATLTGTASNATTAGGLAVHANRNNEVNKIVRTDGSGYIQAGWINTTSGDNGTTAIDRIYASSDAYIRYYTPANFRTVLDVPTRTGGSASGTWAISVTGNAATATNVAYSGLTGTVPTWNQNTTGNAATASTSSQVTINYSNNSDASYQMLWGSGNSVYGTAGITCNPFTDTVNLTGTLNSAGLGVVGFGRMYGGDFWHSGTANNGTRTPTLKLGRFSDSETPAYIVYTNDTDTDTLEFFSERYAGDFRLTRNSETGLRNMMRVNSDNNGTVLDLYTGDGSTLGVKLQSNGDARFAYDVVAYYSFSDARLKTNVATIQNPLQKVMAMRGVSYEWNEGYKIGKKEIGLIAQEVMEIIPEVVAEKERVDGSKFLSVDYEHLTGLLIEAVKELKREVDELKSK